MFGKKPDDETKKMAENIQNLSNQIAALKQQLNDKNKLVEGLQQQLQAAKASASTAATDKTKVAELERKLAEAQAGHSAESAASEKLLKQAQDQLASMQAQMQQAATTPPAAAAPAAAAGGLAVGATAWVTHEGGLPLRVRSGPGLENSVRGRLQPGAKMTLLAGPQAADGYSWWQIRADDGQEGWVAGNDLRAQPD